ncbi:hypothetical protein WMY93_019715 [Mugilogobius chulae]|uniref:RING-type E3 ubiquitin transferase n=1 Tax=Mugilogobius chulae TaxID=88201 RepID=A0AAW0NR50_9GOBI
MAEAAVPTTRYFCHICKSETAPNLPDLVCPKCDSGFIEEVEENSSLLQNNTSSRRQESSSIFPELWQLLYLEREALLSNPSSETELDDNEPSSTSDSSLSSVSLTSDLLDPRELQTPNDQEISSSSSSLSDQTTEEEGVLQQFFAGLFNISTDGAATPSSRERWRMFQLHSSPGDYAWGQRGLDAVITDLLGRFDNTGPPPAEKESISSLPTVCITKEHTDCRLDCPVCKEEYSLDESVRQLPCLHYFHSDCIVPWLELHDTCPVCRKSLSGVDHCLSPSMPSSSETSPEESEELEEEAKAACQ